MRRPLSFSLFLVGIAALAALPAAPRARADETKEPEKQIIVYNKGQTLHYDPDAGAAHCPPT